MENLPPSERTRVQRGSKRAVYDRTVIDSIIDAALFCTVSVVLPEGLRQIPISFVRDGEKVFFHGHVRNAVLNALASGSEACASFTIVDGLVMGRSAAAHSVNFRSVVVYGRGYPVESDADRLRALRLLTERFTPGRWDEVRPPAEADLKATLVVALSTAEASAKIRSGPPRPRGGDTESSAWAGVIPLDVRCGPPIPLDDEAAAIEPPQIGGIG